MEKYLVMTDRDAQWKHINTNTSDISTVYEDEIIWSPNSCSEQSTTDIYKVQLRRLDKMPIGIQPENILEEILKRDPNEATTDYCTD